MSLQLAERAAPGGAAPISRHFTAGGFGPIAAQLAGDRLRLASPEGAAIMEARVAGTEAGLLVDEITATAPAPEQPQVLAALLDAAFARFPQTERALLPRAAQFWPVAGLATDQAEISGAEHAVVERSVLRQLPLLWRRAASHTAYPPIPTAIGPADRLPPLRPPRPCGLMYERWLADLDLTISFRPIERDRDLALFHRWMNDGRVAFFWELAKSREELDQYLADLEKDPHIFGVIASFDGEPAGYFEFYWGKEDRLGPYYQPEDYDRGWHGLIGNKRHLGRPKTLAIFRSVTHYLFLDDPRTMRIVGEPRASHQKMLSYCEDVAYDKVKEFDFPHKRAMFVCCERDRFFRTVPL